MQRQPVLIPTKLEKGKDASYKAVERLRENLDTEGVHNIGITGPYLRIDFFILRILGFKGLFVFMSLD